MKGWHTAMYSSPYIKQKDNMIQNKFFMLAAAAILSVASVSCDKDDDESKPEDVNTNAGKEVSIGGTVGDFVDLGLSVKWATHNLGAASPEDFGEYFVFGETEPKADYTWDNYKWGQPDALTKYQLSSLDASVSGGLRTLELSDDAARVNWGDKWRTPTQKEIVELIEKATWTWKKVNGVNGHEVVGPNGNSIFIPAAGYQNGTETFSVGTKIILLSSTLYGWTTYDDIEYVSIGSGFAPQWSLNDRQWGRTIRPVWK